MRPAVLLCSLLLISGLATGQVTISSGYASNWVAPPGAYAAPYAPLVQTPSISLDGSPSMALMPSWEIQSGPTVELPPPPSVVFGPMQQSSPPAAATEQETAPNPEPGHFRLGVATFQDDYGVAQLAAESHPNKKAARLYTNSDISQLEQQTDVARFGGKTEHLD